MAADAACVLAPQRSTRFWPHAARLRIALIIAQCGSKAHIPICAIQTQVCLPPPAKLAVEAAMFPRNMLTKQGTPCKNCIAGSRCPLFPHAGPDEAYEPAGPPVIPPALLEGLRRAQIEGGANAAASAAAATAATARAGTVRLVFDPIQAFSSNPFQVLRKMMWWFWAGSAARAVLAPCTRPPTAAAAAPPSLSGGDEQHLAACGWVPASSVWQRYTSVPCPRRMSKLA